MTIGVSEAETFWTEFLRKLARREAVGAQTALGASVSAGSTSEPMVLSAMRILCGVLGSVRSFV